MPAPPLPPYPPITRGDLLQSLSDRLNSAIFWSQAELRAYLNEALSTWQAFARYWRQPVGFSTHSEAFFYELSVEVPALAHTSTDAQVLSLIEFHLLEPQSGIPASPVWTGTAQFPQDAYTDAIRRRRDRFLLETAASLGHFSTPTIAASTNRVVLPASLLDVRRVSWVDATGHQTVLWRDDEFAANSFDQGWTAQPGPPQAYSVAVTQPFTIQLIPAPNDIGYLDLIALDQGPALSPSTGVVLGTPDNYAWAVKFGSMADLLSQDGAGSDPQRAEYCAQRYLEAVQLCRSMPTAVNATINGKSAQMDSVFNFDAFLPGWNNKPYDVPQVVGLAGQNLMAISAVPDPAAPFSVGFDAVVNCPLPVSDTASLGIPADVADVLVDYAEHLARFKSGGEEFAQSIPLYKGFLDKAALARDMAGLRAPYSGSMNQTAQLEFTGRRIFR